MDSVQRRRRYSRLSQRTGKVRPITSNDLRDRASLDPVIRDVRQSARRLDASKHDHDPFFAQSQLLGHAFRRTGGVGVSDRQAKFTRKHVVVALDVWIGLFFRGTGPESPDIPGQCLPLDTLYVVNGTFCRDYF